MRLKLIVLSMFFCAGISRAQLTVPYGGTGLFYSTPYGLLAGGSNNTAALQQLTLGTAGQVLLSGGSSALAYWQSIDSLGLVSVPVDVAQGGTGAITLTAHGIVIGQGTSAVHISTAGTAGQIMASGGASADPGWITAVPVANGGTGASTLAIHGVVLGQTTGAVHVTAAGMTGQILTGSTGADPGWSTLNSLLIVLSDTTGNTGKKLTVKAGGGFDWE